MLNNNRIFGLDVLRAYAILSVVYAHSYSLTNKVIPLNIFSLPSFDGVTIFFVLSGFLIGRILLKMLIEDSINKKSIFIFWIRRWFRTIPSYLLILVTLIVINYFSGIKQSSELIKYFVFSQNIAWPHPDFFPEAWSLAVEEWFYLLIPIPIYFTIKQLKVNRHKATLFWVAAIILCVTAFRFYRAYYEGYSTIADWDSSLRKQVVTRLDSLMFGVLGAYLSLYAKRVWEKYANVSFVAGASFFVLAKLYLFSTQSMFYINYFALSLNAVFTLMLLPKLSIFRRHDDWIARCVTNVSLIAYSIYLLHLSIIQGLVLPTLMAMLVKFNAHINQYFVIVQYFLYWLITLLLSALLYYYFERPITAVRDKYSDDNR